MDGFKYAIFLGVPGSDLLDLAPSGCWAWNAPACRMQRSMQIDGLGLPQLSSRHSKTRAASSRAKVVFLYDAFVWLPWPLDLIFKFVVPLGQLLGHLVCTARGIAIE